MNKSMIVPDMMCHNCEKRLEGLVDKLQGIKSITANYETHVMEIEFDETEQSIDQIMMAVSALGFHPEPTVG
jgi:copper chaperone CopZ